jgi:hypothetical protein
MTTQLTRVAEKAKADRKLRFTSLAHLLTPQFLAETWRMVNKKGAPGVDGETVEQYESSLEERIQDLYTRVRGKRSSPLVPVNSVRQQTRHFGELGQQRARAVARQGDRAGADGAAHESGVVQTHRNPSCPTVH